MSLHDCGCKSTNNSGCSCQDTCSSTCEGNGDQYKSCIIYTNILDVTFGIDGQVFSTDKGVRSFPPNTYQWSANGDTIILLPTNGEGAAYQSTWQTMTINGVAPTSILPSTPPDGKSVQELFSTFQDNGTGVVYHDVPMPLPEFMLDPYRAIEMVNGRPYYRAPGDYIVPFDEYASGQAVQAQGTASSAVSMVDDLNMRVGYNDNLNTIDKSTIIAAINEVNTTAQSNKNVKGSWYYCARTLEDLNSIQAPIMDATAFVFDDETLYKWDGTQWQLQPAVTWTVGDEYVFGSFYGTWNDASYTGNATGEILMTEAGLSLLVSESTPVDETTIVTIDGKRQIAPDILTKIDNAMIATTPAAVDYGVYTQFWQAVFPMDAPYIVQNGIAWAKNGDYLFYLKEQTDSPAGKITLTSVQYATLMANLDHPAAVGSVEFHITD